MSACCLILIAEPVHGKVRCAAGKNCPITTTASSQDTHTSAAARPPGPPNHRKADAQTPPNEMCQQSEKAAERKRNKHAPSRRDAGWALHNTKTLRPAITFREGRRSALAQPLPNLWVLRSPRNLCGHCLGCLLLALSQLGSLLQDLEARGSKGEQKQEQG